MDGYSTFASYSTTNGTSVQPEILRQFGQLVDGTLTGEGLGALVCLQLINADAAMGPDLAVCEF